MHSRKTFLLPVLVIIGLIINASVVLAADPAYLVQTSMDSQFREGYVGDTRLRLGVAVENGPRGWLDAIGIPRVTGTEKLSLSLPSATSWNTVTGM